MVVKTEIKKWGNSLALRLSTVMAGVSWLTEGTLVEVEATKEGLTIRPVRGKPGQQALTYSEGSLLADLTPEHAHANDLADVSGNELDY
jgi:antitoxin MazE